MRFLGVSFILLVVTAACGESQVTDPGTALVAGGAQAELAVARPIRGTCRTTFGPVPFPPPPVHTQTDVGVCQVSHLGRTAYESIQQIDFAAGTQSGTRTFTAANGDLLHASGSGSSTMVAPGRIAFTATLTFTGGTGRFEGASGTATVEGEADAVGRTAAFAFEGELAY